MIYQHMHSDTSTITATPSCRMRVEPGSSFLSWIEVKHMIAEFVTTETTDKTWKIGNQEPANQN